MARPQLLPRIAGRLYSTVPSKELILVSVDGPKATIILNNAKIGNALDVDLQKSLIQHFKDLSARRDVRAIVLTAVGSKFCTGMNLGSKGESLSGNNAEQHDRREYPARPDILCRSVPEKLIDWIRSESTL